MKKAFGIWILHMPKASFNTIFYFFPVLFSIFQELHHFRADRRLSVLKRNQVPALYFDEGNLLLRLSAPDSVLQSNRLFFVFLPIHLFCLILRSYLTLLSFIDLKM